MRIIKTHIIILLGLLCVQQSYAQDYLDGEKFRVGLKAGPNFGMLLGTALTKPIVDNGFNGGLYYKNKLKNGFHFQTEISPSIRNTKFSNTSDTGYTKISLFYIDFAQILVKDLVKGSHTHCAIAGIQPSVLIQSWLYNSYYLLSPASRDIKLNGMDVFVLVGYHYNSRVYGIQSVFKIGLTNINRGLNIYDDEGHHLGPTNDLGTIRNFTWETTISF